MPKIKVLPPHIANKIAAGEVVDRPASVVKELVENSLDAGADEVSIIISKAGKELIQVIDNGVGISEDEVVLAFERHATSKITAASDLDALRTLGFRGEALPSIASVSRVEVKTCETGQQVGTRVLINGGQVETVEKIAFKPGTTIAIKNLFFNTPARRNFLRADVTEFNHILKTVKRFFLSYPGVQFSLVHNGETLFELPRAVMDERISDVFGKEFYESLVFVREEMGDTILEGYTCRPDKARGTTENQFIFLNRRSIINRSLTHAIFQGYGNLIDRTRYPQFIMFLELPPRLVDVNVHPNKMEVRFANEQAIYHLFLNAVRRGIQTRDGAPLISINTGEPVERRREIRQHFENLPKMNFSPRESKPGIGRLQIQPQKPEASQMRFDYQPLPPKPQEITGGKSDDLIDAPTEQSGAPQKLWQVHGRYIFSQIKSGLVIIDQNLAHERVLFERTLGYLLQGEKMSSQQLLFPQTQELSIEDFLIFEEIGDWLRQIGFVINTLSGRTVAVEAIPSDVKVGSETQILLEIIDHFREHKGEKKSPAEKMAAAFAAKNAIKSGEKLTPEAMSALVDQLFATKEPYFGPHGRPVIVTLELEELERRFKK